MRQAFDDLAASGPLLPSDIDIDWLILGNIRTDVRTIGPDRKVPWWYLLELIPELINCKRARHPAHAMRCHGQPVAVAYAEMREIIDIGFRAGCDPVLSWEDRALRFGSALHTLQDSYCTAHAARIDNSDPHSPLIDMFTYPSSQHPLTTKRDKVWQDTEQTAFKPEAAAAITATVAALHIFATQQPDSIEPFLQQYLAFREDIADVRHPR